MRIVEIQHARSEREIGERLNTGRLSLAGSMAVAWGILTAGELSVASGGVCSAPETGAEGSAAGGS